MADNKPLQVKFAPGVLEQLEDEMSPEDLQKFMTELSEMAESGEILSQSTEVDMEQLKLEDPELYTLLSSQLEDVFSTDTDPPTIH